MLIRLLKIDWPVGFAAAAEREGGREKRVFAFGGINRRGGHPSNGIRGWERKLVGRAGGRVLVLALYIEDLRSGRRSQVWEAGKAGGQRCRS